MSSISSSSPFASPPQRDFGDRAIEDAVDAARCGPRQLPLHHALAPLPGALEQRQERLGAARGSLMRRPSA